MYLSHMFYTDFKTIKRQAGQDRNFLSKIIFLANKSIFFLKYFLSIYYYWFLNIKNQIIPALLWGFEK